MIPNLHEWQLDPYSQLVSRVPTCPGKPEKFIHFPGRGSVIEFYKIKKCLGNVMEKYYL